MDNNKKLSSFLYITVFVVIVVGMGLISMVKLAKYYINGETDYNEWTVDLGDKLETNIATTFFGKIQFVNLNGAVRRALGEREMNGVVKLNNGYLLTTIDYTSNEFLQESADKLSVLNDYCIRKGISLVYAATPYTSGKYDPELPTGVDDYGNYNIDRFVAMLADAGIDTIDFRETMYEDGIDHYSMMYKTDHHWTTEAGFYAYSKLEDYIIDKTNCKVDERISDMDNYTITTYENWHLGSRGQRTGRFFAGIDDFDLILPNFETTIQNEEGTVGSMQELIINMEPLSNKNYTSRYTYDWVLKNALDNYQNLECENDVRILIVTDSFGRALNPYLVMGFSEVRCIYEEDVPSITPEYIEEYQPNVIILMYYVNFLDESRGYAAFDFQGFGD